MAIALTVLAAIGIVAFGLFVWQFIQAPVQIAENQNRRFLDMRKERDALAAQLEELNTPKISIDIGEIVEDTNGIQTVFIRVVGLSGLTANPACVKVLGTSVRPTTQGNETCVLYLPAGAGIPLSVYRGESHQPIATVQYNPGEFDSSLDRAIPLHLLIPVNISTSKIIRGDEFSLEVKAFGESCAATLWFSFGLGTDRKIWAQKNGATERLAPLPLEPSPQQILESFERGFEEG